jgi:hypothetical protein
VIAGPGRNSPPAWYVVVDWIMIVETLSGPELFRHERCTPSVRDGVDPMAPAVATGRRSHATDS